MAVYQTVMKVQCLIYNTAKIILRLMLNLCVILWEVILKSMTSLGCKRSSIPLKMHQLWSFFIITSFIHERETLATKIRPSMFHKPVCFQCALEIF